MRWPTTSSAPAGSSARATGARCRTASGACCAAYRRLSWWLAAGADAAAAGRGLAAAGGRRAGRSGRGLLRRAVRAGSHWPRPKLGVLRPARGAHARPSGDARRGAAGGAGLAAAAACRALRSRWRRSWRRCCEPAPLDLRVNLLKATREEARAALAAEGIEAVPTPLCPVGAAHRGPPPGHHRRRLSQPGWWRSRTRAASSSPRWSDARPGHARRRSAAPAPAARRWRWR